MFNLINERHLLYCMVLLSGWGCHSLPHTVQLPKTNYPFEVLEGEQFEHCKGYRWEEKNQNGEELVLSFRCTSAREGYLFAYNKQTGDTVLFLPYVVNPEYRRPTKREQRIKPLPKPFYPYLAQGSAYLAEYVAYRLHYDFTYQNVYIAPDTVFKIYSAIDPIVFDNNPPMGVAFVNHGAQRGRFEAGRREGPWVFQQYSDPMFVSLEERQATPFWHRHHFKNGRVHGVSSIYERMPNGSQDVEKNDLIYQRSYQQGQLHGWQYDYQPHRTDSVYYEQGIKKR